MLKSNVGWSTNADSYNQGKESAAKAVVDLIQTKVAFLYTSVDCDVEKVLEGAKSELGTAPIIGCTSSAGIITPDGFISSENGFTGSNEKCRKNRKTKIFLYGSITSRRRGIY